MKSKLSTLSHISLKNIIVKSYFYNKYLNHSFAIQTLKLYVTTREPELKLSNCSRIFTYLVVWWPFFFFLTLFFSLVHALIFEFNIQFNSSEVMHGCG